MSSTFGAFREFISGPQYGAVPNSVRIQCALADKPSNAVIAPFMSRVRIDSTGSINIRDAAAWMILDVGQVGVLILTHLRVGHLS